MKIKESIFSINLRRVNTLMFAILSLVLLGSVSCGKDDEGTGNDDDDDNNNPPEYPVVYSPVNIEKTNPMKVYVHFMPWFETAESSGTWGYHWTMNTKNPDNIVDEETGRRDIASYFYPLTGPYHSGDEDILEYQMLLMKYAGIDGIIIDWYGTYDVYDYKDNFDNSEAAISMTERVGIQFGIMYEDRTVEPVVNQEHAESIVEAAHTDIDYLDQNYFGKDNYINIGGSPALLNFGPIVLNSEEEWSEVFLGIGQVCFLPMWYRLPSVGDVGCGEFSWVYQNNSHLDNFYTNQVDNLDVAIGSAYPGFKDFYTEGGVQDDINWIIEHNDTETLTTTLNKATGNVDHLQLITWNDYGEGTMIEPTLEFGYTFLEEIQDFTGVSGYDVFEDIFLQYELRKEYAGDESTQDALDQSFYFLISLHVDEATQILDSLNSM